VAGRPWRDHLLLAAYAAAGLGYSASYICTMLRVLHRRFLAIAAAGGAPGEAVPAPERLAAYVCGALVPEDPLAKRGAFVSDYWRACERPRHWLSLAPPEAGEALAAYLLPEVDPAQLRSLLRGRPLAAPQADGAAGPRPLRLERPDGRAMAMVLGAARLRYAHLCALLLAYLDAVDRLATADAPLPLELPSLASPEQGGAPVRLRLWDRRSLCEAFPELFSERQRQQLQRQPPRRGGEELFLEALPCGDGSQPSPALWYVELLKRGTFGNRAEWGVGRSLAARRQWLHTWGYSSPGAGRAAPPFATRIPGLLAWPNARRVPRFVEPLQQRLGGAVVPPGALVAAAAFGLLALELNAACNLTGQELLDVAPRLASAAEQPLFCYGGHRLQSGDLAACLRFLLHGIRYEEGGQERVVDGHGSRALIDAILGVSAARSRPRSAA
jgi:hypothetical protein